jgi:5-methyltetrahydropteroyltriglutamate--homocysteine methyltransferase
VPDIDRIRTTHVGSLPRPNELLTLLNASDRGEPVDTAALDAAIEKAVPDQVRMQAEAGIDIVSDGEMSKIGYATYIRHRMSGFEIGDAPRATPADLDAYPAYKEQLHRSGATVAYLRPNMPQRDHLYEPRAAGDRPRDPAGCRRRPRGVGGIHARPLPRHRRAVPAR